MTVGLKSLTLLKSLNCVDFFLVMCYSLIFNLSLVNLLICSNATVTLLLLVSCITKIRPKPPLHSFPN